MTTTDLKPGDVVQHPDEEGIGVVAETQYGRTYVKHVKPHHRGLYQAKKLDGWERVETCTSAERRILDVLTDQRGRPGIVEIGGFVCEDVDQRDARLLAERASVLDEQERDEKPTSATVTLPCPDCGEAVTRTARVWTGNKGDYHLTWVTLDFHACPPPQPDEPTEFGARVALDGHRWLRSGVAPRPFVNRHGARASWEELCATARRATLALTPGWGDES